MSTRSCFPLLLIGALMFAAPLPAAADDVDRLAELNLLRERFPHDVDHALARAQLLAHTGDDAAALDDLRDAANLAPDYEDVWRIRFRVLLRQDDEAARLELREVREQVARRFPESTWWRESMDAAPYQWTLVAGGSRAQLDNGQPSWNQLFVNASHSGDWGHYRFGISRDSRFNEADVTLTLGGDVRIASDWSAGLDLALTSQPSFQPELGLGGHVGRKLPAGWTVDLKYLRREYVSTAVDSIAVSVEKYVGDYRLAYTLGNSHLNGAGSTQSHSLTGNWYYSDSASIGISIHGGDESESVGADRVQQTAVRGISLNGRRRLNERLDLGWWLGTHEQGDYYRRSFLGVAVTFRI